MVAAGRESCQISGPRAVSRIPARKSVVVGREETATITEECACGTSDGGDFTCPLPICAPAGSGLAAQRDVEDPSARDHLAFVVTDAFDGDSGVIEPCHSVVPIVLPRADVNLASPSGRLCVELPFASGIIGLASNTSHGLGAVCLTPRLRVVGPGGR
jgi:hypothetical protein